MPTYQYSCTECGHFFEQFQSFSDDSLTVCPACQGQLRKVFNAVGVVFKGSGFYRTDSRSAPTAGDAPKPAAAETPKAAAATASTGSKGSGSAAKSPAGSASTSGSTSGSAA